MGWFGIKPFASNSLFKGDSAPDSPHAEEDNRIARLAIRYILCNPAITAPIPGLITPQQVDNAALAVAERRELDHGRAGRVGAGHGPGLGQPAQPLPVAEGLGIRLTTSGRKESEKGLLL